MVKGSCTALIGAQYGSEGKGVVSYHLRGMHDVYVRVGGPNAGHSFRHDGRLWKMQMVPCGWPNKNTELVLGRGGIFNLGILRQEMDEIAQVDPSIWDRVRLDVKAGVLDDTLHHKAEGGTQGELHQRIGSTGEGVGAAREARMSRDPRRFQHAGQVAERFGLEGLLHPDTAELLHSRLTGGQRVLLEGTQGSALSLIHGPWPYCTSADTNAAQMLVDCGVAPKWLRRCVLVARTYPIRVAGNSGPMLNEITWDALSARLGRPVLERTTVTQKVRRVGMWDESLMHRAVLLNGPTSIALMFADYLCPEDAGKTDRQQLSEQTLGFVRYIEANFGVPVSLVGTGGDNFEIVIMGTAL